jgi:hypothetical protein
VADCRPGLREQYGEDDPSDCWQGEQDFHVVLLVSPALFVLLVAQLVGRLVRQPLSCFRADAGLFRSKTRHALRPSVPVPVRLAETSPMAEATTASRFRASIDAPGHR